jgi:hypothetical protein
MRSSHCPSPRVLLRFALPFLLLQSACGTLIGTQKPVARKASDYQVLDLSTLPGRDWERLPSAASEEDQEISDRSYQSMATGGVISLNSACRRRNADPSVDLRSISQQLFLGIQETAPREERPLTVDGAPALSTTVEGTLTAAGKKEPVKLRAVVLRKEECVYDLMYVARPERFAAREADFSKFVESLRVQ